MSDWRDAIDDARKDARRAKEEAKRLRDEAKNLERRLRDEARDRRKGEREERKDERKARRDTLKSGRPKHDWHFSAGGPAAEETFDPAGLKSIRVHQTAGSLIIAPCKDGETPGVRTTGHRSAPTLEVVRGADSLNIEVRLSKGWLFRRRRGARTTLRLGPEALENLDIDVGYGFVRVDDVQTSNMKLHAGAGDVSASDCSGDLDVDVGAGKVTVTNHKGLVRCNTGTGDATVDIAEAREGRYSLDVGMGRVELRLPAGESAHIEVSSGIGRRRIDYPNAGPDAPISVRLNTGIGEAVVRERPAGGAKVTKTRESPSPREAATVSPRREADELRILQMLEQGKLSSQEAAELIAALHGAPPPELDEMEAADDQFLDDEDPTAEPHPTDALDDADQEGASD